MKCAGTFMVDHRPSRPLVRVCGSNKDMNKSVEMYRVPRSPMPKKWWLRPVGKSKSKTTET